MLPNIIKKKVLSCKNFIFFVFTKNVIKNYDIHQGLIKHPYLSSIDSDRYTKHVFFPCRLFS
jgi:hypothetical protein